MSILTEKMPIINQIIQERVDVWYGMLKSEKLLIRPIRENDVLENDTDGIELSASVLSLDDQNEKFKHSSGHFISWSVPNNDFWPIRRCDEWSGT